VAKRVGRAWEKPKIATERITVLDDRLLHMTREEAKAHLDAPIQQRERTADGCLKPSDCDGVEPSEARRAFLRRVQA
jgi:hypothetical protein